MSTRLAFALLLFAAFGASQASALTPTPIAIKASKGAVAGKIDGGEVIALDWAQSSAVACFPGNHFDAFRGKHVLYKFDLPAKSIATITLRAKDPSVDLNLYTYRAAVGEDLVPPNINGTQCEASYGTAVVGTKPNPGEAESIEMWAIDNPYTIYVGVAGYKGVTAGAFDLTVAIKTAPPPKTGKITGFTPITVTNGKAKVTGNIDGGVEIDLDWAQRSAVACFPGNHFEAFDGKHVLYRFDLPAKSVAKIKMTPKSKTADLNMYVYRAAVGEKLIPPAIYGTQCEASYATKVPGTKPNPGESEDIEMWAIDNPYSIYIGVAGYKGVTSGDFEIAIDIDTAAPPKTGKIAGFTPITVTNGKAKVMGKIDGGVEIDLDWAQRSAVACFPGNHFEAFDGKHVLYRFDLPAKSVAKIKMTPKSKTADLNLYTYRAAVGEKLIPPEIYGTQCEASYAMKVPGTKPNPGEPEEIEMWAIDNPYSIYIGVAGYKGVTSGDFEISIDINTAAPPKTGKIAGFTPIAIKDGKATVAGKIDGGVEIDLDWAQGSAVACFPGNHFDAFSGKHVLYRFDLPAKSTAKITLIPKSKTDDLNLYTYRAAVGEKLIPPEIYGTQCEASYATKVPGTKPNPGEPESIEMVAIANPYSIYVGVAGYKGVVSGDFEIKIDIVTAAPPKAGRIKEFKTIPVKAGKTTVQGSIDGGVEIDLDWAQGSAVACFPGNHFDAFSGKHVLYRFDLPAKSVAKITMTPKSKTDDLNLYTYRAAVGEKLIPPEIYGTQCEASYATKVPGTKPNPGEPETIEMVAIDNPYSIYIGVAGYKGVTAGAFDLTIELVTGPAEKTGKITVANPVPVTVGKVVTLEGKLDPGVEIPLTWAESSNVACFGGHRFAHYEGKHVLYRFEQPADTTLTVRVTPKRKDLDVSLYVYRTSPGDTTTMPPNVSMATCEASFGKNDVGVSPNPGDPEWVDGMITVGNPYTVYIGVAGAKGVTSGDFTLEVDLKAR